MSERARLAFFVRDIELYSKVLATTMLHALVERLEAHVDQDTVELIAGQVNRRIEAVLFHPPTPKRRTKTSTKSSKAKQWGN
jgi:hypothetical protein